MEKPASTNDDRCQVFSVLQTPVSPYKLEAACSSPYRTTRQGSNRHGLEKVKRRLLLPEDKNLISANKNAENIAEHARLFSAILEHETVRKPASAAVSAVLPSKSFGNTGVARRMPSLSCVTPRSAVKQSAKMAKLEGTIMKCCRSHAPLQSAITKPSSAVLISDSEKLPPLPESLQNLCSIFAACEMVLVCSRNHHHRCLLPDLQRGVLKTLRMPLTFCNFGQILSIYPEAYVCYMTELSRAELDDLQSRSTDDNKILLPNSRRMLAVMPNFDVTVATKPPLVAEPFLPCHVAVRKACFIRRLGAYVERYHYQFVSEKAVQLNINVTELLAEVPTGQWHDDFSLASVPAVVPLCLPVCDEDAVRHSLTGNADAVQLLETAAEIHKTRDQINALKKESCESPSEKKRDNFLESTHFTALLGRVRQRQIAEQQKLAARDPAYSDRVLLLKEMSNVARLLRSFFMSPQSRQQRSTACSKSGGKTLTSVVNYLRQRAAADSVTRSGSFCVKVLEALAQLLPEWLVLLNSADTEAGDTVKPTTTVRYVCLTLDMDFCQILTKINAYQNRYVREGRWESLLPAAPSS